MLLYRILSKDLKRKKGTMAGVFVFIMLSSLLVSSGSRLIIELNNSLEHMFETAKVPHFVQMHSGDIDLKKLNKWSESNFLVQDRQIVEMISIDGSALFLNKGPESEENSIMDISFVRQNKSFDFLLDTENRIIELLPGEVAVPVYYAEQKNVEIGDLIRVRSEAKEESYKVSALIRDAQMNPAIVHSKRFLLNDADFDKMRQNFDQLEYLIEFRLNDTGSLDKFTNEYLSAGMPQQGPTVDYHLFKILNSLSDGMAASVVIILSILLMLIAILCLRLTIITTIEEDYKEIGVMKAVGMPQNRIKCLYLFKYNLIGAAAVISGYLLSHSTDKLLMANSMLYIGRAPKGLFLVVGPILSAASIFLFIMLSIDLMLKRIQNISAARALQEGDKTEVPKKISALRVSRSGNININFFLGLKDVIERFRVFSLLAFIFFLSAFITILPVHFLSTISSPDFITYMGIGKSDIRIDLHKTTGIEERFEEMINLIDRDNDVALYSPLVTSKFTVLDDTGHSESLMVETGDFSIFSLDYLSGRAPQNNDEIALSYLNSQELNKNIGDVLIFQIEGNNHNMRVCGIYQDITNGGRTAKASLPHNKDKVLWYTLCLNLKSEVLIPSKVHEYSRLFYPARVSDLDNYKSQTLSNTITQFRKITIIAIAVGASVAMLISYLFLKMIINRDSERVRIMRSLGFSLRQLKAQYLTTTLILLVFGIVTGTIFTNTAGQAFISYLISFLGAARIRFIINPFQTAVLVPVLLISTVSLTTAISVNGIKEYRITASVAE
ncbi:MAG: ABC transporter permease [Spirochaetales bacterium]|nr:ABC transporter permease [Spirochaetales bacterium]